MADPRRFVSVNAGRANETGAEACANHRAGPDPELTRRLTGLLREIAGGDRTAFTEFYHSTHDRVFGLCLRILRRPAAAEEVTQEIYLYLWNSASQYDARLASPIGWLMMLTHRRAVDRVRVETASRTRDLAYGQRHLGRDHDIVAEAVGQRSEEQAVIDCLSTLTGTQRETVALAYYGGRTYAEVADHLGIPLNTVKTRIRDGLKRLQNCLTGSLSDA
ncbi:sigma-70 family RNA polymerase sigma factor [Nocardia yunnanensis]|uniref:Sigma-70 family RNA polymerase sigma factor n=1 Tax=Nocardia yunnanensis TaxID=2382165 RepID=A0A386ZH21_9NOCA|nr:ECF RNA polymerase sigma factor SigK [Nocardia yunnanensis]AYF75859.1 sigma-70 family RNA polymerase sigma factor [Nocardia yunnanensis]